MVDINGGNMMRVKEEKKKQFVPISLVMENEEELIKIRNVLEQYINRYQLNDRSCVVIAYTGLNLYLNRY